MQIWRATVALVMLVMGANAYAQPQQARPRAAAAQEVAVTRDFLIGRWTDTGDCNNSVDFLADGRFTNTSGARGRWELTGDRLTFIGQRTVSSRVRATGRDSITLTQDDGTVGQSTRCATPSARQITMPPLPASAAEARRMGGPVTPAYLLGTWTDEGDCGVAIQFFPDGRFTVPTGSGRWTLVGDRLSFIGNTTATAEVFSVGRDRILLIHADGSIGQSMRCS